MKLTPKNWKVFQHYKDRCPPWIKLHRDLLNDRAFMSLSVASKALAPMLWLLASESADGSFDGSPEEIEFRTRMPIKEVHSSLKELISKGFFVDASNMLAECLQDAIPERETETESETKKETDNKFAPLTELLNRRVEEQVAKDFIQLRKDKRAKVTMTVIDGIQREAGKANLSLNQALTMCVERGWQGFKAEWARDNPAKFDPLEYVNKGNTQWL